MICDFGNTRPFASSKKALFRHLWADLPMHFSGLLLVSDTMRETAELSVGTPHERFFKCLADLDVMDQLKFDSECQSILIDMLKLLDEATQKNNKAERS